MKRIIILCVSWALVLASMGLIFAFSSENSDKSSKTSSQVVEEILKIPLPDEQVTPQLVKKFDLPMIKIAHFSVFAMLGFFVINAFYMTINKKPLILAGISLVCSILYAISDEIHQKFVDGRVMSFVDVLIDSIGSACGILFYLFIIFMIFKIKNKKQKKRC